MKRLLRVGSWNVHEGISVDPSDFLDPGLPGIASTLLDAKLDVAALQEVKMPAGKADADRQLQMLGDKVGLPHVCGWAMSRSAPHRSVIVKVTTLPGPDSQSLRRSIEPVTITSMPNAMRGTDRMGVALLSKFPLLKPRRKRLRNPRSLKRVGCHDKGILSAQIEVAGLSIRVASLHAVPFRFFAVKADDECYRKVWKHMARIVRGMADRPMILAGDFNSEKRSLLTDELERISAIRFKSALHGRPTTSSGKPLDDILYTGPFALDEASIQVTSTFSDHSLCVVEFKVNPAEESQRYRSARQVKADAGS
jgi:endonuclease/exonuclease/phosphatase family metal-dependent hydrolase